MRAGILALYGLAILTPFPASAQLTGSRLHRPSGEMVSSIGVPDDLGPRPSDEAVRVMRDLTKCLVKREGNEVRKYLASTTDEMQKTNLAPLSSSLSDCFDDVGPAAGEISIGGIAFPGALAEALLARQDLESLSPVEPSKTEVPYWLSSHADQRVVEEMAICLSDQYPRKSAELVQSAPGSPAETAAFNALTPLMGPCLISGATLHANRVGVRLALAEALYHRVTDATPTAAATAERGK